MKRALEWCVFVALSAGCFSPVDEGGAPDASVVREARDAGAEAFDAGGADAGVDPSTLDAGTPDAGATDAGARDAGTEDAGVDGGLDAGLPVCQPAFGSCANARTGSCTLSGRCDGDTSIRSLTCVGGSCTCRIGSRVENTFVAHPDVCTTPRALEAHWDCSCGWATPVTPTCGPPIPGQLLPLGAPCNGSGSCQGGVCVNRNGTPPYCSAECYLSCPCGFSCVNFFGLAYCEP
jgi:hypothetical protein